MHKIYKYKKLQVRNNNGHSLILYFLALSATMAVASAMFFYMSVRYQNGVILNYVLKIPGIVMTGFYWIFSGLIGLGAIAILFTAVKMLLSREQYFIVREDNFTAPRNIFNNDIYTVNYQNIEKLTLDVSQNHKNNSLYIEFRGGEVTINEQWVSSPNFLEILNLLQDKSKKNVVRKPRR